MLLADPAGRDHAAGGQCNGAAEHRLRDEDAFGVVAQGAIPKVGEDFLALVKPSMASKPYLANMGPNVDPAYLVVTETHSSVSASARGRPLARKFR